MKLEFRRLTVITGDPNLPDPTKREARYHDEDTATYEAMKAAFESMGRYEVAFANDHRLLLDHLREDRPDLVVNFCDTGFHNIPVRELNIPAYLELLDIPYTGAGPLAMSLCYDKAIVRLVAHAHGVQVPREVFMPWDAPTDALPNFFPAIIKPNKSDGSVGITKDAVVYSRKEATDYLGWLREEFPGRDVLFQEYLPGPEYGIGVIGNPEAELQVLPPLEVDFSNLPPELPPILSFESKAFPDSPYWTDIKYPRATMSADLERQLSAWARFLFKRLGLQDYGRFDYRVAADGAPRLMEVNPNPAWANDAKLAMMAGFAGIAYPRMLKMIIEAAIKRIGG